MLETYQAILRDNQVEWTGDGPKDLPQDQPVRVYVTLLERGAPRADQGQAMAAALDQLAALHALKDLPDPAAWERAVREDRPLPDHDD